MLTPDVRVTGLHPHTVNGSLPNAANINYCCHTCHRHKNEDGACISRKEMKLRGQGGEVVPRYLMGAGTQSKARLVLPKAFCITRNKAKILPRSSRPYMVLSPFTSGTSSTATSHPHPTFLPLARPSTCQAHFLAFLLHCLPYMTTWPIPCFCPHSSPLMKPTGHLFKIATLPPTDLALPIPLPLLSFPPRHRPLSPINYWF